MKASKKQVAIASVAGTIFVGTALSPAFGALFAFCMFTLLTM